MNQIAIPKDAHLITTPALEYTSNPLAENNEMIAVCQNTHGSIRFISQNQFHGGAQDVQSQIRPMSPTLSNRPTLSSRQYESKERKIRTVDSTERQSSQKTEKRSFIRIPRGTILPSTQNLVRTERAKNQCFQTLPQAIPQLEYSPPVHQKENQILFEGSVFKFKPGLKNQYIQRYAVLTHKYFRYYKNKFSAHCWMSKPLMSIAIKDMGSVERVYVTFTKGRQERQAKNNYQFQIFLKESGRIQNVEQNHISILDQVLKKPGRTKEAELVQKSHQFKITVNRGRSAEKETICRQSLQTPLQQIYPAPCKSKPDSSFHLSPRVEAGHMMRVPSPRRFKQLNLNISSTSRDHMNSSREKHSRQASIPKQGSRAITPTHFQLSGIKEEYKTGDSEEKIKSFRLQQNKPYLGNISPTNCSWQRANLSEMNSSIRDQSHLIFQSQLEKSGFQNFIQNGKVLESAHTVNRVETIQTKNPSGWIKSLSGEKFTHPRKRYLDESGDFVVSD